jgi:integrase/recombinase XerD
MHRYNPKNERIKKEYFDWLKQADRKSESTIDGIRKAITRFEDYTGLKDFATFNKEQVKGFKKRLAQSTSARTGEPLAKATMLSTVNALKAFFRWLSCQPGYKRRINVTDIEYLNLSEKDTRVAKAPRFKTFPTLEQIRNVLSSMPSDTMVARRDRALIAFTILTGMRDSALASLRLKHVDIDRRLVIQDPREVRTKKSKRIDTYLVPLGADIEEIVIDWIRFLREELLFGNDDPVFPRTRLAQDETGAFATDGLEPVFWSSTEPIRKIFREAFENAGLPYFNPHSFRDTLVQLGERTAPSIEHFKAWSQNLGHEHVQTTMTSYGIIGAHRQGELVRSMAIADDDAESEANDRLLFEQFQKLVKATK